MFNVKKLTTAALLTSMLLGGSSVVYAMDDGFNNDEIQRAIALSLQDHNRSASSQAPAPQQQVEKETKEKAVQVVPSQTANPEEDNKTVKKELIQSVKDDQSQQRGVQIYLNLEGRKQWLYRFDASKSYQQIYTEIHSLLSKRAPADLKDKTVVLIVHGRVLSEENFKQKSREIGGNNTEIKVLLR